MLTFPNIIIAMITPFNQDGSVNYEAVSNWLRSMPTKVRASSLVLRPVKEPS